MNVPAQLTQTPKPRPSWWQAIQLWVKAVSTVINGNIEFGNPTSGPANIRGVWASVTAPGAANTDFTVVHNLGRPAVGYLVMTTDRAVAIYTSPSANGSPNTQTILRAGVASAVMTLFIL